jgi:hypothetical protein
MYPKVHFLIYYAIFCLVWPSFKVGAEARIKGRLRITVVRIHNIEEVRKITWHNPF